MSSLQRALKIANAAKQQVRRWPLCRCCQQNCFVRGRAGDCMGKFSLDLECLLCSNFNNLSHQSVGLNALHATLYPSSNMHPPYYIHGCSPMHARLRTHMHTQHTYARALQVVASSSPFKAASKAGGPLTPAPSLAAAAPASQQHPLGLYVEVSWAWYSRLPQ